MIQDSLANRELVSALADGQLHHEEFAGLLAIMNESGEAVAAWHAYHLVGDVLRCKDLADCRNDVAFVARLRNALSSSVQVRPSLKPAVATGVTHPVSTFAIAAVAAVTSDQLAKPGTNDSIWRWKILAGAASFTAVAAIALHFASFDALPDRSARLSQAGVSVAPSAFSTAQNGAPAMTESPVMLRDARLDELLAAHKQFGGMSALQMPAGFLRNATFENTER